MTCEKCKIEIPEGSKFCNFCGLEVGDVEKMSGTEPSNEKLSSFEGTQWAKNKRFCKRCGGSIDIYTKKCSLCGKRATYFTKNFVATTIIMFLIGLNLFQFIFSFHKENSYISSIENKQEEIDKTSRISAEKIQTITDLKANLNKLKNEIKKYQ